MSVFDKTRYLRAVFIILPFGALAIYFGLKGQFDLPRNDELIEIKGVVAGIQVKSEYSDNYKMFVDRKRLFLIDHSSGYIFNKQKDYEVFKENFWRGDTVLIWINPKTELKAIRKFATKDKILLEYKRFDLAGLLLATFGIFSLVISLVYILKNPEDLFGK